MQDYSAVQYRVIASIFPCKKTMLGDINQSVNPFSASGFGMISKIFGIFEVMVMKISYRSTFEITNFTKRIAKNLEIEPLERHGDAPEIITCKDLGAFIDRLNRD